MIMTAIVAFLRGGLAFIRGIPWQVWAGATLVLAFWGYGSYKDSAGESRGRAAVQAEWDKAERKRTEAEKAAVLQRLAENHDEQLALDIARTKLENDHAEEIRKLRADIAAAPRLRIPAHVCGGSSGAPKTESTGGGDGGGAATRMVSEASQRDFDALDERIENGFAP